MTSDGCLSDLPDDLLRHVLSLAPAKEAASTAVLSRRWRSLWCTSGAVNIDSRSYGRISVESRERFVRGVRAALDAAGRSHIRRLTVHVELEAKTYVKELNDLMDAVVSHPAARSVEVIHVGAYRVDWGPNLGYRHGFYELSYGALPSEALRVLHISNCSQLKPAPPGTTFPWLAELRLKGCWVSVKELQTMINISPQLVTMHLEHIFLGDYDENEKYVLCCPFVTALVFKDCLLSRLKGVIELDVPRLRYLRFKGSVRPRYFRQVSLKSQELDLDQVDVHLTEDTDSIENKTRVPFWQFLQNFSKAKVMKLKLDYPMDHVAVVHKNDQDQLLCNLMFCNLSRLELEGTFEPSGTALAVANLLHSCPVLRDLQLKLKKAMRPSMTLSQFHFSSQQRARRDFNESVENFRHCRNLLGGDHQHDDTYKVSDIPSWSGHSFKCLQSCLRRVTLQFQMQDGPNCFGTQLAKFFAQNAVVLEELYIDDGIHRIYEHMNLVKIGRWSANSPKRRNSLTAKGGITVLPHET